MPKQEKKAMNLNLEDRNKLKIAFVSPQTVKYNPIQLHLPDGPDGSFLLLEAKMAEEHLFSLCNLSQTLHKVEESQNSLNFHLVWSKIEKVMATNFFCPVSPQFLH